jgi:hypothetical protein
MVVTRFLCDAFAWVVMDKQLLAGWIRLANKTDIPFIANYTFLLSDRCYFY